MSPSRRKRLTTANGVDANRMSYKASRTSTGFFHHKTERNTWKDMKILMTYPELQQILANEVERPFSFARVDAKTLRVFTEMKALFFAKTLRVDMKIEELKGTDLHLSYGDGMMKELLLKGVMRLIEGKLPDAVVEQIGNGSVVVHLSAIEQLSKVLQKVTLHDLKLTPEGIELQGQLNP